MAGIYQELDSGSTTPGTLSVYEVLESNTTAGVYYSTLNLENLVDGEDLTIRIRVKTRSASSLTTMFERTYSDIQTEEVVQLPGVASSHEYELAIKQDGGTLRAYEWSVAISVDAQDVAEPGDAMDLVTDAVDATSLAATAVGEIVDGVWDELKSAHTTPDSFGDYLDIEVSSRTVAGDDMGLSAAGVDAVWDELKAGHTTPDSFGDYLDDEITSRAVAGDAMDLVPDAVDATALAASAISEIVDGVWDELKSAHTTPDSFGDYLDIEVSSRAVAGDAMDLSAGAVDDIWDELKAGHTTPDSFGDYLDDEISSRAAPGDAMDLVPDSVDSTSLATSAVNEIVDQVWEELIADHDGVAGSTAEALSLAAAGGGGGGGGITAADVWIYNTRQVSEADSAGSMQTDSLDLISKVRRMVSLTLQQLGIGGDRE